MPTDDLIVSLINHPMTWVLIMGLLILFILKEINKGKIRPEQRPDFGRKFRAKRVAEHLNKRGKALAIKPDYKSILFNGIKPIGKILSIEEIPQLYKSTKKQYQVFLWVITYRRFGIINWLMAVVGFGRLKILVDKDSIKHSFNSFRKHTEYVIDKDAYFRERGGLLLLSREPERKFIDEINADMDYENAKGFVSDFPRRLSNLHPSHAIHTDTLETEQTLEEKSKRSFIDRFRKGN